jgi:general secretion pathway protein C
MPRPWYARRGLELALLVVVTSLAALGVSAALRAAVEPLPPDPPPAAESAPPLEPLDAYAPIVARDVFGGADASPASTTTRLVGVGFQGGEARAAIEDTTTHRQDLVRVGDALGDGRVKTIAWDHLVLASARGETTLELVRPADEREPDAGGVQPVVASGTPSPAGVRQTAANAFIVDRRELQGSVDSMSGLMTQLRAVAEVEDGRPAGFRLFQINDGSIFRRLGLENGDVVQRVNGQAVSDPSTLLAFLQRLRTEPRVALDIRRGAERRTLVYDLR